MEAERRKPNGVRLDPIFRKECGGEVIKKLNFIIRSERFFADCFSLTFGILPDGSERERIGGRSGRKKSFRAGTGLFRFGVLGALKKRTANGKLSAAAGGQNFYSEQQGSWRIFGACGGRQGVRAFWRES